MCIQGGPKSKPLPYYQKCHLIVLLSVNEICFLRQVKVTIINSVESRAVNDVGAPSGMNSP